MAFCKQCGTDMGEAKFCPSCGAAADGAVAVQQTSVPGADVRQRSMADMEHMMKYFGVKQAQYDEFDAVEAEVAERSAKGFGGWIGAAVISIIIGFFGAYFFFVVGAGCIALYILLKKKNKEKLAVVAARMAELENELTTYYNDYGYCPVGFEYTNPTILGAIYEMIRKGRCSTPGDAINLYLDDLHKAEMEQMAAATQAAAEETARSSKKAARYASANFWFK